MRNLTAAKVEDGTFEIFWSVNVGVEKNCLIFVEFYEFFMNFLQFFMIAEKLVFKNL